MQRFVSFVDKYMPGADKSDFLLAYRYAAVQTLAHVPERCGNDPTRAFYRAGSADALPFDEIVPA